MTDTPLPKWQLALAVGTPIALGLGYIYYKKSSKSKENGTSAVDKQISIDIDYPSKNGPSFEIETPLEKAQRFKNNGNNYFKVGKYDEAIVQYNNAIEVCPKENTDALAIFYQNRAAAYEQLKKYSAVKADCTKALELKPKYAKALLRRARAKEYCDNLGAALEDTTAAYILGNYCDQSALIMAERVLKKFDKHRALEYSSNKRYTMPSKHSIKNYINAFQKDPVFTMLQNVDNNNISPGFAKILKCVKEQKYNDVIPLCNEEINSSEPETLPHKMEELLLRGTFYFLQGQYDAALKDFGTIICSDTVLKAIKVNALVKRATLHMQLKNPEKSFHDFQVAVELDPGCSDIYSHKGQVNLFMEKIDEAREDFKKTVELNPDSGIAYVQKCYVDYQYGIITNDMKIVIEAMRNFKSAFKKFPDCSDCYILYAQILSEKQKYYKADTFYKKALEKDPNNAIIYAHRAMLQLMWDDNVDKAIEYINKAIELDDECQLGYEILATIEFHRGNLEEGTILFNKALSLNNTIIEIPNFFDLNHIENQNLH